MMPLEKKILNQLLDTYERSKLSRGENKVAVHISYAFQKKNIPEYFDESSMVYEEIHAMLRQLEARGFLTIEWKNNKVNHIVRKVILCEDSISEVYQYMKRIPKMDAEETALKLLETLEKPDLAQASASFVHRMAERIREGKTVKEYLDITNPEEIKELVNALNQTERNGEECFLREFSIRLFHDSKRFEQLSSKICRIIREEISEYESLENDALLSEYQIYRTPSYVYLKGDVRLEMNGQQIRVNAFPEGFGFALNNQNLGEIRMMGGEGMAAAEIESVYTIENLTTFFRFHQKNSLILYLGGYHNHVRRAFLKKIYETFPNAGYYHFGDIDAGGFQIYYHLKEKTNIPFALYRMDTETLKNYEEYGKKLTENDKIRLKKLRDTKMGSEEKECADYMLAHNVKLEQECVQFYVP
ncbi:MAG: DUF2220 family protein [Lachnospiraceae bacterium]|nr:DUF2220 family protein [Lachnospiraceae bacterium]